MSRAEKKAVLLPILAPSPQEARLTLGVPAGQVGPQRVTLISAVAKSHLSTRLICSPPFIRVLLLSAFAIYFNLKSRLHSTYVYVSLVLSKAFIDCMFQWEISCEQITRERLVQS